MSFTPPHYTGSPVYRGSSHKNSRIVLKITYYYHALIGAKRRESRATGPGFSLPKLPGDLEQRAIKKGA